MVILGVADGPSAAAAVVVDDALVALATESLRVDPTSVDALPWRAIDDALTIAGVSLDQVDVVAVAGRFSPLLAVRRRPWLSALVAAPFSLAMDAQVAWQAFLRVSGFGAVEADRAAEWVEGRLNVHGITPERVLMVDAHRALAEAVYRCASEDDVLIVGLQPMGDGTATAVHRGQGGQLDRLSTDPAVSSLHTHLARVTSALGLGEPISPRRLGALAARGTPDPVLLGLLASQMSSEGTALARWAGMSSVRADDPLYARIRSLSPEDAAASIHQNLTEAVTSLVRRLIRLHGVPRVALVGEVFEDPRIVARIAELEGITKVFALPASTAETLAMGAATSQAGLGPALRDLHLGADVDGESVERVLAASGLSAVRTATLPTRLAAGVAVARVRGRGGPGPRALGARCVLVRADDAVAIARARKALRIPEDEEALIITIPTPNEGAIEGFEALRPTLASGAVAPKVDDVFKRRYAAVIPKDGRVWMMRVEKEQEPGLHSVVQALVRASGCGAVAALPLPDNGSVSDVAARLVAGDLTAAQLGPFWVDAGGRR